jgi:hypothetical protein
MKTNLPGLITFTFLFISSIDSMGQESNSQQAIIKIQPGTSFSKLDWKIGDWDLHPFNETLIGYSVFAGIDYFDRT